jgi:hypothetical protein
MQPAVPRAPSPPVPTGPSATISLFTDKFLAFHQIKYGEKEKSIKNIKCCLSEAGRFILCDTLMLFDPEKDRSKFNGIYRYLLPITTPRNIYGRQ